MISFNATGNGLSTVSGILSNLTIKQDVNINSTSTSSDKSLKITQQLRSSAQGSKASIDREFENLYETNVLSNNSILKSLKNDEDSSLFQEYIAAFAYDDSGNAKDLSNYEIEGVINTIGATYAALTYQIENGNYSNKDKETMLSSLERQFEQGVADLTDSFGASASSLFSSLGVDAETKNVAQSLTDLITEQKDHYLEFINSDEGKKYIAEAQNSSNIAANAAASSDGSASVNLLTDDGALTQAILRHEAESRVEAKEDATAAAKETEAKADETTKVANANAFTLDDLEVLGELQSSLTTFFNQNGNKSEEEIGYQLGLTYIKAQEIMTQGNASSHLSSLFNSNFDNFVDSSIDAINKSLKQKQAKADEFENTNENAYKSLDESTIQNIYNQTISAYQNTGSTTDAVINGFEMANSSFIQNQALNSSTIRYSVGDGFFDNFYHSDKNRNGYSNGMSTFRRYTQAFA